MNTFLYTESDATIYRHKSIENLNTGYDEILELENTFTEERGHHMSRLLMKFDTGNFSTQTQLTGSDFFLQLKITETLELTGSLELEVFPMKTTWSEGVGRRFDNIEASGATWITSDGRTDWGNTGGDFYSRYELDKLYGITTIPAYKFDTRTSDVAFDITEYVDLWLSGHMDNNGLVIKFTNETTAFTGKLNFFSKDTNTIYQPYLKISTNDYIFNPCGCDVVESIKCIYDDNQPINSVSGSSINSANCDSSPSIEYTISNRKPNIKFIHHDNISISITGLTTDISVREQLRMKVNVRDKFPVKSFSNKSRYTDSNFVDHPMYYSVIDADTKERILGYDKYTRISCNGHGHYFDFDFGCLSIDRIYYFEIRVESPNQVKIHEDNVKFKVKR